MSTRETVPPGTLRVDRSDEGIVVRYLDGRRTVYRLEPEVTDPPLRTKPERLVQVLQVDESFSEGVLVYINDRDTAAEILEESGVGRVNLTPGESASVLPGVAVEMEGHSAVLDVDPAAVAGRLFVFAEGQLGSAAYEVRLETT